jgi:hypothetical protein
MRRILSSVFIIVSLLGVGVYATGAYFTDTITQNDYTFTTSSADLKFAFCGSIGTDCSTTAATLDNHTFTTAQETGPGKSASGCLVVENTGSYAMTLSSRLNITDYSHIDMAYFFLVSADRANSSCFSTSVIRPWARAQAEANAGLVPLGISLAPGERLYLITYNDWDSTGDQNYLENGLLELQTIIEGKTA